MAINFPDSPTNGQQTSAGGNTWQYNSAKSVWEKTLTSGRSSASITTYANISDLPLSGVSVGDQAFVIGSNRMYISNGTGWYSVSLVNTNPNITSIQDASSNTTPFTLATDGTATVITVTAADPEEVPLTYGYSVTSGSLNGSTVAQGTGEGYAIASAAILSGTHTVTAYAGALTFKPDGTEMYYVSTNNDRVNRNTLSTAWDVSTASFVGSSPNTLSQVSNLTDVKFNNDGTKMYMADRAGTTDNTIYQYSLSTAWDPDTATYDNKSYDFSSVLTGDDLNCFVFNADGTAVYLAEHYPSSNIYQFTLSTAFDISTASYSNKNLSLTSIASNGFIGRQYFQFTNDGSKLFLIHTFHPAGFVGKIYEYSLTTAYDISTASHTSVTYTPTGITGGRSAIAFKPDGSKMFIMGTDNHTTISQFNLPVYADNQFVINPSTTEADAGTFTITFTASDGINQATSANEFSLSFVTIVTDSNHTTLLATATGTSDNNNITDSSSNSHSITVAGDTHAGTFSPYRSGGYSTFFNTATSHNAKIDLPTTVFNSYTTSNASTSNFTIQAMIYPTGYAESHSWGNSYAMAVFAKSVVRINLGINSSGYLIFHHYGTSANDIVGSSQVPLNEWSHVAIICTNGSLSLKLNGTQVGTGTWTGLIDPSASAWVGAHYYNNSNNSTGNNGYFKGYITDFKISSVAETITAAPTLRLVSDSNTELLLCHLPYIADGSSNSVSVTPDDVSIKPFSPYDYEGYSATDHGGSMYFDGSGDALTIGNPPTLGANDYTVESWVYFVSSSTGHSNMLTQGPNTTSPLKRVSAFNLLTNGSFNMQTYDGSNRVTHTTSTGNFKLNNWHHVAITHEYNGSTGGTYKFWVDGELVNSGTKTYTNSYYWNYNGIGNYDMGINVYRYNGTINDAEIYYSDYRISDTVRYTSSFTPPTAPLSSSGASLHIKGTDASIIDKSQGSNLKLVGDTTGSTTTKFTGAKSMYFDGSGDRATATGVPDLGDDFTIECWVYSTATGNRGIVSSIDNVGSWGSNGYWSFGIYGGYPSLQIDGGSYSGASTSLSTNQWVHIAVTRTSNTIRYFINGTVDSTTVSNSLTLKNPSGVVIGSSPNNNYIYNYTGYIQDLRIANECKYTANFTPPTAPLEG